VAGLQVWQSAAHSAGSQVTMSSSKLQVMQGPHSGSHWPLTHSSHSPQIGAQLPWPSH
jgi:hypothetical protein